MDNAQFSSLIEKINVLIKLLALNIMKNENVNEQINILTKIGLKAKQISEITGKTENQVYVTQNKQRKKKPKNTNSEEQIVTNSKEASIDG